MTKRKHTVKEIFDSAKSQKNRERFTDSKSNEFLFSYNENEKKVFCDLCLRHKEEWVFNSYGAYCQHGAEPQDISKMESHKNDSKDHKHYRNMEYEKNGWDIPHPEIEEEVKEKLATFSKSTSSSYPNNPLA